MKMENPFVCLPYAIFLTSLFSETSGFEKTGCSDQQAVFFPEAGKRALSFFVASPLRGPPSIQARQIEKLTKFLFQTDRQTDGWTDGRTH